MVPSSLKVVVQINLGHGGVHGHTFSASPYIDKILTQLVLRPTIMVLRVQEVIKLTQNSCAWSYLYSNLTKCFTS